MILTGADTVETTNTQDVNKLTISFNNKPDEFSIGEDINLLLTLIITRLHLPFLLVDAVKNILWMGNTSEAKLKAGLLRHSIELLKTESRKYSGE